VSREVYRLLGGEEGGVKERGEGRGREKRGHRLKERSGGGDGVGKGWRNWPIAIEGEIMARRERGVFAGHDDPVVEALLGTVVILRGSGGG